MASKLIDVTGLPDVELKCRGKREPISRAPPPFPGWEDGRDGYAKMKCD
jgi:hypothetical protein